MLRFGFFSDRRHFRLLRIAGISAALLIVFAVIVPLFFSGTGVPHLSPEYPIRATAADEPSSEGVVAQMLLDIVFVYGGAQREEILAFFFAVA